ncbi:MAG: LON peptidase substrate-binding domain-containing protein [Candidatus Marinimicrobia bacterium]|nr:LON peptidase substrate-binding domain-containing protein [Candidatus Neomarinimicrobiota bacterium]
MKPTDDVLNNFNGTTPLFPLPDYVLFPKTVQPFHIFEPRYLDMVRDSLAGERLITIALQVENEKGDATPHAPFHQVATLSYINQVRNLDDGTLKILVTGLTKVSTEEVDSDHAYRLVAVRAINDFIKVTDGDNKMARLMRLFQDILDKSGAPYSLEILAAEDTPIEIATHIIISALAIDAKQKQGMLELQSLELRLEILMNFLESGLHSIHSMERFEPILPNNPQWN